MIRNPNFFKGELKYFILKSLASEPLHGYLLMKRIEENSMGMWKPTAGSLYPALTSLKEDGFIEIKETEEIGRNRKIYRITKAGKSRFAELSKNVEEMEKIFIECAKKGTGIETDHEDAIYLLETIHKILASPGFENYRGAMMEFASLSRRGKLSKRLEAEFIKSFKEFLEKIMSINANAKNEK